MYQCWTMTCPQRNHHLLLIYCLFVLLHVQQSVNSLENGYHRYPAEAHPHHGHSPLPHRFAQERAGAGINDLGRRELVVDGVREREREHHFRHQHNRQLHHRQQQHHDTSVNSMRNEKLHHPHSGPPPLSNVHHFASRRIEEAVHAFRVSTTERPVALHEHSVHKHDSQPLQRHHVLQPSARHHLHNRMHQHTLRPNPDVSQESWKKSLAWPADHHPRLSASGYDFTTASPVVLTTEPSSSRIGSFKVVARAGKGDALHAVHAKHSDAKYDEDDLNDDDEYYYYEGDNDQDDEEHVNQEVNRWSLHDGEVAANGLSSVEATKGTSEGVLASDEDVLPDNAMDYDEHNYLADEPNNGLGSISEQKWQNYSTMERVKKMAMAENPEIALKAHLNRINEEGLCRQPHPKVIRIVNDPSKIYSPHCTILHRCGDDTGCCLSDTKTCVAKSTEDVDLYFHVIGMRRKEPVIETLTLINHTECHCVNRMQVMRASSLDNSTPSRERFSEGCVKYFDLNETDREYVRCECIDRNLERREACQRLSRGEEGFSLVDQRCISQRRCKAPTCEYGQYNITMGRCPSKDHKFELAKKVTHPFH